MSAISHSYGLCRPYVTRRQGSLLHIVRREHFQPGMLPHAERWTLDGTKTGGHIGGRPGTATCPRCRSAFRKILAASAALISDPGLVLCPDGCTRPDGRPVLCDPVYADAGGPYATGEFTCPLCRREHRPDSKNR